MTDYTINSPGSSTTTFPENLEVRDKLIFNNTSTGRDGTILDWTVPVEMEVRITAYGAQGGAGTRSGIGGKGAKISGEFELQEGNKLDILVGQEGGGGSSQEIGGGGGSFVTHANASTESDILIIAGGGGGYGVGSGTTYQDRAHAPITKNGKDGYGGSSWGAGGTNGSGGEAASSRGSGGGGYSGDGQHGGSSGGGQAFLNGALGGVGNSVDGGYGCGGATDRGTGWGAASGGGGYSGGGGAYSDSDSDEAVGGGGGSYNNGTNQDNESGVNTEHGLVEIEILSIGSFTIKGKVTLNSTIIEGAKVRLINDTTNTYVGDTLTDVNGEYEFNVGSDTDDFHAMVEYESGGNKYHAVSYPFIKGEEDE